MSYIVTDRLQRELKERDIPCYMDADPHTLRLYVSDDQRQEALKVVSSVFADISKGGVTLAEFDMAARQIRRRAALRAAEQHLAVLHAHAAGDRLDARELIFGKGAVRHGQMWFGVSMPRRLRPVFRMSPKSAQSLSRAARTAGSLLRIGEFW